MRWPKIMMCILAVAARPMALHAQGIPKESNDVAEYEITARSLANSVELTCVKGCAWTKLAFRAKPDAAPVAVDFYGIADIKSENMNSPFMITVAHSASKIQLTSSKGSAWRKLEVGCRIQGCTARITQDGVGGK
jgi:hypothetical protein